MCLGERRGRDGKRRGGLRKEGEDWEGEEDWERKGRVIKEKEELGRERKIGKKGEGWEEEGVEEKGTVRRVRP